MSYFPQGMPRPEPNMDDQGFWRHCAERKLAFQACADCGAPRHPPTPVCWKCRSMRIAWKEVRGEGEVFSYTVIHHAVHEVVAARLPYAVAVIAFPELPGPRLVSNLTDVALDRIRIGMRVKLWWDDIGEGMFLPRFRPAEADGAAR
jgi:hypothetical protein